MNRIVYHGVPAMGHFSKSGYWHPGAPDGCVKCDPGPEQPTLPFGACNRPTRNGHLRSVAQPCVLPAGHRSPCRAEIGD